MNREDNLLQYGKIPPQAIEIEEAVLGAFLLEEDSFLLNQVNPDIFYRPENHLIYSLLSEMNSKDKKIDLMTFTQYSRDCGKLDECGGVMYITELTSKIATAANVPFHIGILKEKFTRRRLIADASDAINKAYDESTEIEDIITAAENVALNALDEHSGNIVVIKDTIPDIKKQIEINQYNEKPISGIPTGQTRVDRHTGGFQLGDFNVIAALSSDGKTAEALTIAKHAAIEGYPVHITSLEMPNIQLTSRITSQFSGVSSKRILSRKLENQEINDIYKALIKIDELPIYYESKISANIDVICNSIRKAVLKYGIKLAIIDYLQLCEGQGGTDEAKLSYCTRKLKALAVELNINITALAQFVKIIDRTTPPKIGELKGSAAIEQDADNVIIIFQMCRWMPNGVGYEFNNETYYFDGGNNAGLTLFEFAKGRNIGLDEFLMTFIPYTTKFVDHVSDVPMNEDSQEIEPPTNFYEKEEIEENGHGPF